MKNILTQIGKQLLTWLLFWLFVFTVNRIVFYVVVSHLTQGSFLDIPLIILHAIRLDFSMLAYIFMLPTLLIFAFLITKKQILIRVIDYFFIALIVLYAMISIGEYGLYLEWKAKLNMQALLHFANPNEVFKTVSWFLMIGFIGLNVLFDFGYIYVYKKWVQYKNTIDIEGFEWNITKVLSTVAICFVWVFGVVVSVRGGLQACPIQSSDAYFSKDPVQNDIAVNPMWNLAFNMMEHFNKFSKNPYDDFSMPEARQIVADMYALDKDTTIKFLNTDKPNIVYILMESWSASCIKGYGGDDFAPFFSRISQDGLSFTNAYPGGYVSDQGVPAALMGYPGLSRIAVINESSKSKDIPCISEDLKKQGYATSFCFGGDLNYGNLRSFAFQKQFDVVKEEKDLAHLPKGKLGIHDNYMNMEFLRTLNGLKPPFMGAWFTVSTHMPYDYEGPKKNLTAIENDFVNSISFSDNCLKKFFDEARKQPWYKNTLFVFVSDHSHASHRYSNTYESKYHHVPMLFYGDVIKKEFRGKQIDKVCSQLDLPKTILSQIGMEKAAQKYVWSKNMMNPYEKEWAYFCSYDGAGLVVGKDWVSYRHKVKELMFDSCASKEKSQQMVKMAKAFQQVIYEDYRLR